MRYPADGGMNTAVRVRREKVRIQATAIFEDSKTTAQIASELRVSGKSVREWRRNGPLVGRMLWRRPGRVAPIADPLR